MNDLGAGGSVGFAIPSKNLSFAFVMNQLAITTAENAYVRIEPILKQISMKIDNQD